MVSRNRKALTLLLAVALACAATTSTRAAEEGPLYVTLDRMEADKCASIWLIRRHIAPTARFAFVSPADEPPPGILFDTPAADFQRRHNRSTFEDLVAQRGIDGERVRYIARIIHDIEINTWQRKALPETRAISAALSREVGSVASEHAVECCVDFFDRLPLVSSQ